MIFKGLIFVQFFLKFFFKMVAYRPTSTSRCNGWCWSDVPDDADAVDVAGYDYNI